MKSWRSTLAVSIIFGIITYGVASLAQVHLEYENDRKESGHPFLAGVHETSMKYPDLAQNVQELEDYGVYVNGTPQESLPDILDLLEVCYGK